MDTLYAAARTSRPDLMSNDTGGLVRKMFRSFVLLISSVLVVDSLQAQSIHRVQLTVNSPVVFPVKASPNSRYLVDQNNKPFPILGRTAWFIISQPVSGYRAFIEQSVSFGYNSIEMHVLDHDPRGNHPPFNGNGDLPFLKQLDGSAWNGALVYTDVFTKAPDLTTPNEKYWKYVDDFLAYCESQGILVFFFPAYIGCRQCNQGWLEELVANGSSRAESYGAWIARRYRNQKNIVWMLLGDMGYFTVTQRDAQTGLIRGLKSIPGQQSVHYTAEAESGQNSAEQKDFGAEMTINATYTWGGAVTVPHLGRKAYSRIPVMPAFLLEEPYDEEGPDGNSVNPHAIQPVRRHQWWGWLSTTGGYIAGNGYVWPFVDPHWRNHLDTKGSRDMSRLNRFIRSIAWWELIPSGLNGMRNLITEGGGIDSTETYVSAAATAAGTLLIAYVPPAHLGSITVDITGMGKIIDCSWYDPTSGNYIKIPGSPFSQDSRLTFAPPEHNSSAESDWVLVLTPATGTK